MSTQTTRLELIAAIKTQLTPEGFERIAFYMTDEEITTLFNQACYPATKGIENTYMGN